MYLGLIFLLRHTKELIRSTEEADEAYNVQPIDTTALGDIDYNRATTQLHARGNDNCSRDCHTERLAKCSPPMTLMEQC